MIIRLWSITMRLMMLLASVIDVSSAESRNPPLPLLVPEPPNSLMECGEIIYADKPVSGLLTSPPWPARVVPFRCFWNITTDLNHTLRLRWLRIDLPEKTNRSGQCLDAHIMLSWPDRVGVVHSLSRVCGKQFPSHQPVLQNSLQLLLVVERSTAAHAGFAVEYEVLREENVRPQHECDSERGVHSGRIWTPGWPSSYITNTSCEWLIRVPPEQLILVQILFVHITPTFEECERASLTIQDGYLAENRENGPWGGVRFCGPASNYHEDSIHSFLSTSNRLLVKFRSDSRPTPPGERFGFKLSWTAVESVQEENSATSAEHTEKTPETCSLPCESSVCIETSQGMCSSRARICVNASLACDGNSDCPFNDYSDERGCTWKETTVLGVSTAGGLITVILLSLLWEKRRRRRRALAAARLALHPSQQILQQLSLRQPSAPAAASHNSNAVNLTNSH